jgi:hypothetical protein
MLVPFAAVFGLVVAAEDGYLAWLLGADRYLVLPVLLAAAAVAGAALLWLGRRPGWALLGVAAAVSLLGLLAVAVLFALLGGGAAFWSAVLLLIGPVGCLALTLRAPVRSWRAGPGATRSPGGRRAPGRSR